MITFSRQDDGTYRREGALAKDVRRVRIDIDGRPGVCTRPARQAMELVESAIARGRARAHLYSVIEIASAPLDEQQRERFALLKARVILAHAAIYLTGHAERGSDESAALAIIREAERVFCAEYGANGHKPCRRCERIGSPTKMGGRQ